MKARIPCWLTALGILLAAAPASAQLIPSPYRFIEEGRAVTVFVAGVAADEGELELGPRSGVAGGGRFSLRVGGPFTLEGAASFFPTTRRVWRPGAEEGLPPVLLGEADLRLLLADGALRFNLTGPRAYRNLQPYLLAGGGAAIQIGSSTIIEEEALEPDERYRFGTSFAPQFGGGLDWFVGRRLALRADARNVLWRISAPATFLQRDPEAPSREWAQNFWFSLGAALHF